MNDRISRPELYMGVAELFAQRSTCDRLHVGVVIVNDHRIITTGYNGALKGSQHCHPDICIIDAACRRAVHAEANAIAWAAKEGIALEGTTMYCTHSPCLKCAELIIQSGITQVTFKNQFRTNEGVLLLKEHKVAVYYLQDDKYVYFHAPNGPLMFGEPPTPRKPGRPRKTL